MEVGFGEVWGQGAWQEGLGTERRKKRKKRGGGGLPLKWRVKGEKRDKQSDGRKKG